MIYVYTHSDYTFSDFNPETYISSLLKTGIKTVLSKTTPSGQPPRIISHSATTTHIPEQSLRIGKTYITISIIYEV
jgi:hypothetical protein